MKSDHSSVRRAYDSEITNIYTDSEDTIYAPPLLIVWSGTARWTKGHEFKRKKCDFFGVELVTAGNAIFVQDGKEYLVAPGETFLLRKGANHVYSTGPAGFLHKRYVAMRGTALDQLLHTMELSGRDCVRPFSPPALASLLKQIHTVLTRKPVDFVLHLSALAYQVLVELSRSVTPQHPLPVKTAIDYMQQNLTKPFDGVTVARHAGLSQTHFNRLFKKHMRVSPLQYFLGQRMAWARHLLGQTSLSVKEISAVVGYDDPLYFSSQFKKHTGLCPRAFREAGK